MERIARDATETIKITCSAMHPAGRRLWRWALVLLLSLGAIAFASPRPQTAAAIALALTAYKLATADWGRHAGTYAGVAARVVRTQMLFVEDSAGRTRAWLGVENEFDDESGARLVFYDEGGRARLTLRFADEGLKRDPGEMGARAETSPGQIVAEMHIPPPFPPGQPPPAEEEARQLRELAVHAATIHVEMESEHARNWARTRLAPRPSDRGHEADEGNHRRPELVMFHKGGRECASLASELVVTRAESLAVVGPEEIVLMSHGDVKWQARAPSGG